MKRSLGAKPLGLPAPVWVVGSYSPDGSPAIMVVSWGGICCSTPPCVAISIDKTRFSHANIIEHRAFTVNVPSRRHLIATDYLGLVSGATVDKFSATGLTAVKSDTVQAPFVKEFPLVFECRLLQSIDIGSHTQFIGQIMDVKADEAVLDDRGNPVAGKVSPLISSAGDRSYYALGEYLEQAYVPGMALMAEIAAKNGTNEPEPGALAPGEAAPTGTGRRADLQRAGRKSHHEKEMTYAT
ncbi:flavin reductase family protein [Geobacter sp. AOG2]|uniref:flavin reductase family protein n=1 Tax=Geobacter sp. AOG2 TaxID=1566347 RepID=UPI00208A6E40|nr:flavin reductase family protein [Geobacter sp. AOG2]GFE59879.1 flavodoxin [Geobacter sp. AOG2]